MKPLQISHFSKRYGTHYAVDDLSLSIDAGTVYGLIGRNGAGKSTTIVCALGLVRPSGGSIEFFGEVLTPSLFERIAYVPEINVLDGWMTTLQHAEFRRRSYARFDTKLMRGLIELFEITPQRSVRNLSKGQRQAVALALAFAQRPDLMVLDEPASGLDPVLQRRLLDQIVSAAADGTTIVFSSHQIGQVEQAAERVGILDCGKLVLDADVEELRAKRFLVEAIFADGRMEQRYANGDVGEIEAQLRALSPVTVARREMSLEQVFFATIGAGKEYRS